MEKTMSCDNESKHRLQLNRSLIEIENYAEKYGLNLETVEQYARLGYIEIRRFKGKAFVVDVPMNRRPDCEIEAVEDDDYAEDEFKVCQELAAMVDELESGRSEVKAPDMDLFELDEEEDVNTGFGGGDVFTETRMDNEWFTLSAMSKLRRKVLVWKSLSLVLCLSVVVSLFCGYWFYTTRALLNQRLESAYTSMQAIHSNYVEAKGETKQAVKSAVEIMLDAFYPSFGEARVEKAGK
jgi:hypothetical protein